MNIVKMSKKTFLVAVPLLFLAAVLVSATSYSAIIGVEEWYPKGTHVSFYCDASFPAIAYDWDFGDGQKLYDVSESRVYHVYATGGQYHVSCTPSGDAGSYAIATMNLELAVPKVSLDIAPWFPQGLNYVFECNAGPGIVAYDWDFGDGQKLYDVANQNVWHTFDDFGSYTVSCTATDSSGVSVVSYLTVDAMSVEE